MTVTLPSGIESQHQCTTSKMIKGWSTQCQNGSGGGLCFGDGLCQSYIENASGQAFATTVIMDKDNSMRLLRTELANGEAVHFFRERLFKQTNN